jgi:MFS family permease
MDELTRLEGESGNPLGRVRTLRLFYVLAGIGVSAWAITVPFTKIRFGLNDATLGIILLGPGISGIIAMPFAAILVRRFGSRAVLVAGGGIFASCLPALTFAPDVPAFAGIFLIFGAAFAAIDIAMNAQAVVTERRSGRLLMSSFHAMFSIGALAVAVATSFLLKLGAGNGLCSVLACAACFGILSQYRQLLPKAADLAGAGKIFALPGRATLVLGLCCFGCFLTEGAVTDWSTIFLHFSRAVPIDIAPLGYAGFAVMMSLSRLGGDRVAMRLGKALVMRLGCVLAGAGILLAIFTPWLATDVAGFALAGLGIGNIAPLVFSAAARVPGMPASASAPPVMSLGYLGFLVGPVVIGCVANAVNLGFSLGLAAAMLFGLSFAARAVAP